MDKKTFQINQAVTVFDREGVITEVIDETREPYLYAVTFNDTQKVYIIEAAHIEAVVDNRSITERVKTFEDACDILGCCPGELEQMWAVGGITEPDEIAYQKLRLITAALNEGWVPQFTDEERRYYPWFELFSQEELDEMDEETKEARRVVFRSSSDAYADGGVAYAYAYYGSSSAFTNIGSRLAFKSRELAEYAGKQFTEIYADFVFKAK